MNDTNFSGRLLDMPAKGSHCCAAATVTLHGSAIAGVEPCPGEAQSDLLLMPPIVNAHDHVRGVRPISLGAFDMPLELWLTYMTNTPRVDPYLVTAAALGRQALGGVGAVMIHYTRPQDPSRLGQELEVVAKAAEAVGMRVAIAVAMRDRNPLGYAPDARLLAELEPAIRQSVQEKLIPPAVIAGDDDGIAAGVEAGDDPDMSAPAT